jgi:hypothetical protein
VIKLGVRTRLRIVVEDFRSKRKARVLTKYWDWIGSGGNYLIAPQYPRKYI